MDSKNLYSLITGIAWPLFSFAVLISFRKPISSLINSIEQLKISAGSAKLEIATAEKAATSLAAAAATHKAIDDEAAGGATIRLSDPVVPENIINKTKQYSDADTRQILSKSRILWVDDNPRDNQNEKNTFEYFGITIDFAKTTDAAISRVDDGNTYHLAITDMRRDNNPHAGYQFLEKIKEKDNTIPVIIYSYKTDSDKRVEAKARGAIDRVSDAVELFDIVMSTIKNSEKIK